MDEASAGRGRVWVPACWGLRPPRDSTPCPRHWFGLFGLRSQGRERARRSLSDPRHRVGLSPEGGSGVGGRPPGGRGAPLPANPCSFVTGHHVSRGGWVSGKLGVVLYSPQTLVPSSWGTTSLGPDGPPASWTWCSAPREPLFLRRGAPRLWGRMGLRQVGRGASLPANPCSFVVGHHAFGGGWASGKLSVVLHSPRTLVPSSRGTTPLGLVGLRQVGRDPARPALPKK